MKHYLAVALLACALITSCKKPIEPYGPLPTDEQLALQDMEMYAFLHYSLNTYTDQEWGFGNEDPTLFNPTNLDTRQWVRTCKNAGMNKIARIFYTMVVNKCHFDESKVGLDEKELLERKIFFAQRTLDTLNLKLSVAEG